MYAIVDIETTGGHAATNGITEIAIFIHDGYRVVDSFHSLVNPGVSIPVYITSLTGISNSMVASAPVFTEIAERVYNLLNGRVFIAHNVNFDYSFILHYLKNAGFDMTAKKLCTVRLSRKIFPGFPSYSLGNLCRSLNIPIENRHRAAGDAYATVLLFEKMLEDNSGHIQEMLKRNSREQWLPSNLDKELIDQLSTGPGVYFFYDKKGKIIYVGKANNVRKRVSSHFTTNDTGQRRQHFLRYVHKITCTPCASELHALVYESTQIRKHWPKYNYSQKQPVQQYALYQFEDNRGYIRLAIDKRKKHLPSLYTFTLLNEGYTMLNKMVQDYNLDQRLCFIDKSTGTYAQLPAAEDYNLKARAAIAALKAGLPTFAIIDKGITENDQLCLLMEKGSFWGMGYVPQHSSINSLSEIKNYLEPFTDNDYIRNSIYNYAEQYPDKLITF